MAKKPALVRKTGNGEGVPWRQKLEQGGSALVMETGRGLKQMFPGALSGLCRGTACSYIREICREMRYQLLHWDCFTLSRVLPWFILQLVDSGDTRLYSLRAAGSWPAAVSLYSLKAGWCMQRPFFFKLAGWCPLPWTQNILLTFHAQSHKISCQTQVPFWNWSQQGWCAGGNYI